MFEDYHCIKKVTKLTKRKNTEQPESKQGRGVGEGSGGGEWGVGEGRGVGEGSGGGEWGKGVGEGSGGREWGRGVGHKLTRDKEQGTKINKQEQN